MHWSPRTLRLYHGTDAASARSILSIGIQLDLCLHCGDFGRGFYLTTNKAQALRWARLRSARHAVPGPQRAAAVLAFDIEADALAQLPCVFFVRGNGDFWDFVAKGRAGLPHGYLGRAHYPAVAGPVAGGWRPTSQSIQRRFVYNGYDQISMHNQAAIDC